MFILQDVSYGRRPTLIRSLKKSQKIYVILFILLLTKSLQYTPFQNPGGLTRRRTSLLVSYIAFFTEIWNSIHWVSYLQLPVQSLTDLSRCKRSNSMESLLLPPNVHQPSGANVWPYCVPSSNPM